MKRSDAIIIVSLIISLVTIIMLNLFAKKTQNLLVKYANNQTNIKMNNVIDNTIRNILTLEEYNNIIEIEKNEKEEITNINFNNSKINKILTKSSDKIMSLINKNNEKIYKIPFGLISDNHLIHNIGPNIPYAVNILGNLNNNTFINIKEYGINNSIIELILKVEIEYQIMLAFTKETKKMSKEIILESKIIQGNIPSYYGNVNSLLK